MTNKHAELRLLDCARQAALHAEIAAGCEKHLALMSQVKHNAQGSGPLHTDRREVGLRDGSCRREDVT